MLCHQLGDFARGGLFGNGYDLLVHHRTDAGMFRADLFQKLRREVEAIGQHVQPPGLPFTEIFGPANQIALAEDPDEFAVGIDNRHPADTRAHHRQRRLTQRGLRMNGNDLAGHQIRGGQGRGFEHEKLLSITGVQT